ncbi:peptide ABC transporter substrate-binding protein [Deinococcus yavapaiensis]|uniref:Peptide/nickel transport system substrate-binding protein n=1 Tax=Deinococcus yavapaiensis KR-236 TaxID=694435 RepID=A0A318SBW5_9DEIO|nr:peptide ABC transporter substrate-binding protein [Deinococcus yavapaiensis]PYE54257.1 peptide/nickel transport system substrate-binding protein [Deinococcus yavapaiensis KR-236]
MKKLLALSLLMLGAALAGPRQNNVIIATSQEPANILDYWSTANQAISAEINGFLAPSLIQKNNAGDLFAVVASRVPSTSNGDIKITRQGNDVVSNSVTYRIRPEAKWSDGTPITTRDFQFWLDVAKDERVPIPARDPWDRATIARVNDKTFTITYNKGGYIFADQVSPGYAPAHVMQADWNAFKSATDKLDAKTQAQEINNRFSQFLAKFTTARSLPRVSAGPFRVTSWSPGSSMTLTRNPNFWIKPQGGENKYAREIIYRFIGDTNTLRVNILSGQIDAVSSVGLTFDQGLQLQPQERGRFKVEFVPGAVWEHIDVNQFTNVQKVKDLGLDDKRTRQAILYAMNRESLVQQLYQGKQPVSSTFVSTFSSLYKGNVKKYDYNPTRAKQLLAELGWKAGADGILVRNGKRFTLNFTTTAGNRIRERVQQILIRDLKAVGIEATVANQPSAIVFDDAFINRASEGKWDMFMFAYTQDPATEDAGLLIGKLPSGDSNIPTAANGYSGQVISGWNSAAFDRLAVSARTEFDPAKRKQLFSQMQDIFADELPILPLYNRSNVITRATGLVNYTFSGANQYPGWNAWTLGWQQNGATEQNPR